MVENAVSYAKKSFLRGRPINRFEEFAPAAQLWLETVPTCACTPRRKSSR
jgi:hypothetical protein